MIVSNPLIIRIDYRTWYLSTGIAGDRTNIALGLIDSDLRTASIQGYYLSLGQKP